MVKNIAFQPKAVRSYQTYIADEIQNLEENKISAFVDVLTSLCPRNRNWIVVYVGQGTSEIARFCLKSELKSDFNLFLGMLEYRLFS